MFRIIRLTILVGVLVFVEAGAYLSRTRSTGWGKTLWIAVHPINADGSDATTAYIAGLSNDTFSAIEEFMQREAGRYQLRLTEPVRVELYDEVAESPPLLDRDGSVLSRA